MRKELQTAIYHQKLAYKAWLGQLNVRHNRPVDEAAGLVWELMVAYGHALDDFGHASEDIYKTAYDLAEVVLEQDYPIDLLFKFYRDYLVDCMMEQLGENSSHHYQTLCRFSNMVSTAFCEAYSDSLKKTIRHERAESIANELKLAKQIQSHLLPKQIPSIDGYDFAGRLLPAADIGGDYWSIKYHPEDNLVTLKLADISGHGIAAATLVAAVKFISGGYYQGARTASEVMRKTNHILTIETPHDVLVTMVYAWLWPDQRKLSVVNAGHSPVMICRDRACIDISPTGPLLALNESTEYEEIEYDLQEGDIIFFGSDGIIEAGMGQRFGLERLKKLINDNAELTADEIADRVLEAVMIHTNNRPEDDVSLLVTKITG